MTNPNNAFTITGRLAADPKVFPHPGRPSATARFVLFAKRNRADARGNWGEDIIPCEMFVPNTEVAGHPALRMRRGDLINCAGYLTQEHFHTSTGEERFELRAVITDVTFLEPRSVAEARRMRADGSDGESKLPIGVDDDPDADALFDDDPDFDELADDDLDFDEVVDGDGEYVF